LIRNIIRLALVASALVVTACVSTGVDAGRDFQESKASQVVPGMTKNDVVGLLGQPMSTLKNGGQEQWSYYSNVVNNNATAIAGGTIAASTVASTVVGTLVPGAAPFVYLGTAAAGLGVMEAAQRTTVSYKSLQVSFAEGRVVSCLLTVAVSDSRADGPKSGTEMSYCGGSVPSSAAVSPPGYNPASYSAMKR